MHAVFVHIHVKPEYIEAFKSATVINAENSIQEPGIANFQFFQLKEDPARFILYEVYYQEEGQAKHRQTAHYQVWKDTVAEMMAEPRQGIVCSNVHPTDGDWK